MPVTLALLLMAAAPARGDSFVYVANIDRTISQYGSGAAGALSPRSQGPVRLGAERATPGRCRAAEPGAVGTQVPSVTGSMVIAALVGPA